MDGTTAIKIDYYNELKAKADKWDEKETPYKLTEVSEIYVYSISDFEKVGKCKCGRIVQSERYCPSCGQKLDWEE